MKLCLAAAAALLMSAPAMAQDPSAPGQVSSHLEVITFAQLPDPPVTSADISDRHYTVIGQVFAGVRKVTVFSKQSSEAKIYREL